MKKPENYKERILLVSLGVSPQIVTEVIYALTVERKNKGEPLFLPTKIVVVSTSTGLARCQQALGQQGHYQRLIEAYGLTELPAKIDYRCISNADGPLDDIRTSDDNEAAANTILSVVQELTSSSDSALHISLAGGRKTQGYYTGFAASLFCRKQDRLSHVLVTEGFEGHPQFYFPPKEHQMLTLRLNNEEVQRDAREAKIELADLPFVHMREELPKKSLLFQSHLGMRELARRMDVAKTNDIQLTLDLSRDQPVITTNGVTINLEGHHLAMAYLVMFYLDKISVETPSEEGLEIPGQANSNITFTVEFVNALKLSLAAMHKDKSSSLPERRDAAKLITYFEHKRLNRRTLGTLFDLEARTFKPLKAAFYSTRRTELRKLFEQELPASWVEALLPQKIGTSPYHKITLPKSRFKIIGLEKFNE